MTVRAPSLFRPKHAIDQSVLEENRKLVARIDRRRILRGTVSLGALTMLTGCNVTDRSAVQRMLQLVDAAQAIAPGGAADEDLEKFLAKSVAHARFLA